MIRGALLVVALVAAGCGSTSDSTPIPPTTRAPLSLELDPPPETHGLAADDVDRITESTVRVFGITCGRFTEGSGFAVDVDLIATNAHVVLGVAEPTVERSDGSRLNATVEAFDPVNDLALLRVERGTFVPLALGEAADGTIGAVFGWEPGPIVDVTTFRVDRPVGVQIESVGGADVVERPSYLLSADIEKGDSGAALVDADGVVIGIAYQTSIEHAHVAYAIRTVALGWLIADGSAEPPDPVCGDDDTNS